VAEYLPLLPWVSGQVSKPVPKESESAYFFQVFSGADAPAVVEYCYKRNWYCEKLVLTSSYGCGSSRFKNSMTCLENLDSVLYCLVRNFQLPRHSRGKGGGCGELECFSRHIQTRGDKFENMHTHKRAWFAVWRLGTRFLCPRSQVEMVEALSCLHIIPLQKGSVVVEYRIPHTWCIWEGRSGWRKEGRAGLLQTISDVSFRLGRRTN
jgi:hypothetical protein